MRKRPSTGKNGPAAQERGAVPGGGYARYGALRHYAGDAGEIPVREPRKTENRFLTLARTLITIIVKQHFLAHLADRICFRRPV